MTHIAKSWMTLGATAAFLISPAVTVPFRGYTPDLFPVAQIDPSIQPAGYAFAIWGVIYLWLAASALFGLVKRADDPDWDRARLPLILSLGPGALWLWVAGFAPVTATLLIFWMLGCAIWALLRAPARDYWLFAVPVGLLAGWLTAAAHVSLGVVIAGYGLLTETQAALVCVTSALVVALWVLSQTPRALPYAAAVIWALVGIIVENGAGHPVTVAAALGAAVLALVAFRKFRSGQRKGAL
jgi:hypothetical protein